MPIVASAIATQTDMPTLVEVAVPRPLWQTYTYRIPDGVSIPVIGGRVRVPFGHSTAVGIVIDYPASSDHKLKDIARPIDSKPILTPDLIRLAKWVSEYYHHPLGDVFKTMLPPAARSGRAVKTEPHKVWNVTDRQTIPDFRHAHRQKEVWTLLRKSPGISDYALKARKVNRTVLNTLLKKGLVEYEYRYPDYGVLHTKIVPTEEQQNAINQITAKLEQFHVHVLEGVTGSGKTEVYIRVLEKVLGAGKQALILVPEIALTPQTAQYFTDRFSAAVVLHSMQAKVARFDTWNRIALGENRIVIGTRSTIFTPFKDLGIIVVDEEHDASYKQGDGLRYSARDLAVYRARELQIPCILGSATPSLETIHNVHRERYAISRLTHRPGMAQLPTFRILDIRGHVLDGGMSEVLIGNIRQHLDNYGQVLVLINRRGYSRSLLCHDCGWYGQCEDCEVTLTYHEQPFARLICHKCLRHYPIPKTCPDCDSEEIAQVGAGTQRTEETLRARFPDVPIYRVDRDVVTTNKKMESLMRDLSIKREGILVGTQMLAKGHHFPEVTLVAVLGADTGFLSSDFRAPERTAQLIMQVAGRAGRAGRHGEVWIQTYDPDNPDLTSLVTDGYHGFVETERRIRQNAEFPPFAHLAMLRAEGVDLVETEAFLIELVEQISVPEVSILGPTQAPIGRISSRWRYQVALLSNSRPRLHVALAMIEKTKAAPKSVRWSIDVDPVDMS